MQARLVVVVAILVVVLVLVVVEEEVVLDVDVVSTVEDVEVDAVDDSVELEVEDEQTGTAHKCVKLVTKAITYRLQLAWFYEPTCMLVSTQACNHSR